MFFGYVFHFNESVFGFKLSLWWHVYSAKKNWSKTLILAWNRGSNILLPHIWRSANIKPKLSAKHSQGMILNGFLKKSFFRIGMWNARPPPFMEKKHRKFPFWLFADLPKIQCQTETVHQNISLRRKTLTPFLLKTIIFFPQTVVIHSLVITFTNGLFSNISSHAGAQRIMAEILLEVATTDKNKILSLWNYISIHFVFSCLIQCLRKS